MAKVRKDLRGRSLRKGEVQRSSDKRYMYTYTDPMGRRKFIYANDLAELREKEAKLMKDQLDGLDLYVAGKASVNDTFDRYMSTKYNLRESTKSSYLYTYDHYVRDTFGKKRIADIKYSDVLQFYYYLLNEVKIALGTLDTVHCLLHPTFQLAVRDEIIRNNPTDGVMKEISRESGKNRGIRHALIVEQQRAFMEYIANHPIYYHWWPMFTVLLGTGCRIGEALGLRWQDLDYDKRIISINHSLWNCSLREEHPFSKSFFIHIFANLGKYPFLHIIKPKEGEDLLCVIFCQKYIRSLLANGQIRTYR